MSTNLDPGSPETSARSRQAIKVVAGGSIAEAAAAASAVVLAIIGLVGTRPYLMMSMATIALGAAFLLREVGLVSQSLHAGHLSRGETFMEQALTRGLTAVTIAGTAGVALGILALGDVEPAILVPAAVTVFGGALLFDRQVNPLLSAFQSRGIDSTPGEGGELLVGVGATTMGILALLDIAPVTLSLVALLALGVSTFLVGSAFGTKLMSATR